MTNHFALIDHRREAPATFLRSNGIYNQLRPMERLVQSEFKTVIQYQEDGGENLPNNSLANDLVLEIRMKDQVVAKICISFTDIISKNLLDEVGLFEFFEDGFVCAISGCITYFRYDDIMYITARLRQVPLEEIKCALRERMKEKNGILESIMTNQPSSTINNFSPSDD